jgi:cysteine synthase A
MNAYMHDLIGNTPIIELPKRVTGCRVKIFVKLEEYNWGGSIKSRVGYQMMLDAEMSGKIDTDNPEKVTIVEASGGNTGIGIAQICSLRGYRCILVVPDNYLVSRIKVLNALGATVVKSDHMTGNDSHFQLIKEIIAKHENYIYLNQLDNPSNPKAHEIGTGQEILQQIEQPITHFVAGVGSGGTITGIGHAIKEKYPNVHISAVQPEGCDVILGKAVPHLIQGLAVGRVPGNLDSSIINGVVNVNQQEVFDYQIKLAYISGLFLGYSSIANILASISVAKDLSDDCCVVTVSPDGGRNYVSERDIPVPVCTESLYG